MPGLVAGLTYALFAQPVLAFTDHLKGLDWRERRAVFACRLPGEIVADVLSRLATLLGPPV